MAKVFTRRHGDPLFVRALRDGILKISSQKQCPNTDRIVRVIQQEYEWTKAEILKQLKLAVIDGFFTQVTAISSHGSTKGVHQTAYRIRQDIEEDNKIKKESHDWYCWECHRPGDVILCDHCPRVFHRRCAHEGTVTGNKWKCPSCQPQKVPPLMAMKNVDELSKMLKFTLERMKEKAKDFLEPFSLEEHEDYLEFVFKPVDLSQLERQVKKKQYRTAKEFREDAQWILHDAIIYFGEDTELTELAEAIMEDCDGELEEMIRCPDCYIQSNVRPGNWFCKPCYFPHELVWAKMTGEPPWPSKLLAWNEDKSRALVRFFGSAHQRAWVGNKFITPITAKPEVKKRSQRWVQAIDEMQDYQRQLRKLYPESNQESKKTSAQKGSAVTVETQTDAALNENSVNEDNNRLAKERKLEENEKDRKMKELELEYQKKITDLEMKFDAERKAFEEEARKRSKQIDNLQTEVKLLDENLTSMTETVERERKLAKQLEEDLQKKELQNKDLLGKVSRDITGQNGVQKNNNKNTSSYESIIKEQTSIIKELQVAVEKERQENKDLLDHSAQESQKTRDAQQAVKRALNKERLQKERAVDEAVKKASEKSKLDRDRNIQQALQIAKEEAEKSLQEAVTLAKRKQWCSHCTNEAFYPCCWNTSYCTVECQKSHWCTHRFQCMRIACKCGKQCQGKNC